MELVAAALVRGGRNSKVTLPLRRQLRGPRLRMPPCGGRVCACCCLHPWRRLHRGRAAAAPL
eukprot:8765744-Alexandrium_andersonii.AAC.1